MRGGERRAAIRTSRADLQLRAGPRGGRRGAPASTRALARVLPQATLHDAHERGGEVRTELGEGAGIAVDRAGGGLDRGGSGKCRRAGGHLVQDRAERELVRARIRRFSRQDLRRDVAERALDRRGPLLGLGSGCVRGAMEPGEAEVDDLRDRRAADEHVLRLQIAVDDPCVVGRHEALGDLRREIEEQLRRQGYVEQLAHALALDQLHHDVGERRLLADVVHRRDVRVAQRRRRASLLLEALERAGALQHPRAEDLDRDLALEARVVRSVDLSHPTGAERSPDLVPSDALARREVVPGSEGPAGRRLGPRCPGEGRRSHQVHPGAEPVERPAGVVRREERLQLAPDVHVADPVQERAAPGAIDLERRLEQLANALPADRVHARLATCFLARARG